MITSKHWKKKNLSQYDLQVCQSNLFLFAMYFLNLLESLIDFVYFTTASLNWILLFLFYFLIFMLMWVNQFKCRHLVKFKFWDT